MAFKHQQRMEFTQEVYERHVGNAERAAVAALAERSDEKTSENGWTQCFNSMGWNVMARQLSSTHEYLCIGTLHTTLIALQEALFAASTTEFQALSAVLYEDAVTDAAVLNIMRQRTHADRGQFLGVKFLQLRVPVTSGADVDQEHIYLEYCGTRQDSQGRKTWCVVTEPLAIEPQHSSKARHALGERKFKISASMSDRWTSVKLFRELPDGSVQLTVRAKLQAWTGLDLHAPRTKLTDAAELHHRHKCLGPVGPVAARAKPSGQLTLWKSMGLFIPSGLAKELGCLSRLESVPAFRRLTAGPFAAHAAIGRVCHVCLKSFHLLRRSSSCRRCGLGMCGQCTVALHCVDRTRVGISPPTFSIQHFCKLCLVQCKVESTKCDDPADLELGRSGAVDELSLPSGASRNFIFDDSSSSSMSSSSGHSIPRVLLQHVDRDSIESPRVRTPTSNVYAPAIAFVVSSFADLEMPSQAVTGSPSSPMPKLKIRHGQQVLHRG
ncbi:hypothetical protein H310_12454 [Aphanomyces invadans]|uniref:FYVE-type domain-containing protein n=1 Tax=Aphanomyces invadans TaxID=157072 RepID=A0A024THZ7_9STRA|nr:hypothetical protein H310_12454 [Aphanomyces invadans]ETV93688.1 hypothetical protein H310_12454 [Aphanomyces invadans]|eukprot:XP_008877729.1 hypothetical protein H310_12454 [Aphanomyces invadans]